MFLLVKCTPQSHLEKASSTFCCNKLVSIVRVYKINNKLTINYNIKPYNIM